MLSQEFACCGCRGWARGGRCSWRGSSSKSPRTPMAPATSGEGYSAAQRWCAARRRPPLCVLRALGIHRQLCMRRRRAQASRVRTSLPGAIDVLSPGLWESVVLCRATTQPARPPQVWGLVQLPRGHSLLPRGAPRPGGGLCHRNRELRSVVRGTGQSGASVLLGRRGEGRCRVTVM